MKFTNLNKGSLSSAGWHVLGQWKGEKMVMWEDSVLHFSLEGRDINLVQQSWNLECTYTALLYYTAYKKSRETVTSPGLKQIILTFMSHVSGYRLNAGVLTM